MSRLVLVRHAQASFFSKNYDQLSPLGERQARLLGEFWDRRGVTFDEVLTGPRERHRRSALLVEQLLHPSGMGGPRIEVRPEFDEHAVDQLIREESLDSLLSQQPQLQELVTAYRAARQPEQIQRSFQHLFEAVCHLWCQGAPGTEGITPWSDFHTRVGQGLTDLLERSDQSRNIVLFTSVGNVTSILCHVLRCSTQQALELGWRLKNCSLTEFIFSGSRITLDHFNGVPHLTDPTTWTFR